MLYKPDARKLWKVFHFVCFHFPLFKHFFVFFFIFSRQSKSKRNFTRNIRLNSEITFGAKRTAARVKCKQTFRNVVISARRDQFWWRWKWNYWCRNTENCEILTFISIPLHLFPLYDVRERYTRWRFLRKVGWIIERMKNLLSFRGIQARIKWWWLCSEKAYSKAHPINPESGRTENLANRNK